MNFKFFKGGISKPLYDRNNTIWKTSTGRQTPITWLTTNHIINILGCLRGVGLIQIPEFYEGKTKREWIDIFKAELTVRVQEDHQSV
jgi:hypothetical protein